MHRQFPSWRCSAIRRSCPALPRLSVAASLMGFDPSQLCSCLREAAMFPSRRTHLPFPERPSRPEVFLTGRSTVLCDDAPTMNLSDGRSRTLSAAPGFGLQAIRAARSFQFPRRSMLPWALLALSGFRTRSTYDMHRRDRISRRSSAPAGCLARYPLMGF